MSLARAAVGALIFLMGLGTFLEGLLFLLLGVGLFAGALVGAAAFALLVGLALMWGGWIVAKSRAGR